MCLIQVPISLALTITKMNLPSIKDFLCLLIVGISAIVAHFTMTKAIKGDDISSIVYIDY